MGTPSLKDLHKLQRVCGSLSGLYSGLNPELCSVIPGGHLEAKLQTSLTDINGT